MKNKSKPENFSGRSCHTPDDFNICYPKSLSLRLKKIYPKSSDVSADVQNPVLITNIFKYVL